MNWINELPLLAQIGLSVACFAGGLAILSRLFSTRTVDYRKALEQNDAYLADEMNVSFEDNHDSASVIDQTNVAAATSLDSDEILNEEALPTETLINNVDHADDLKLEAAPTQTPTASASVDDSHLSSPASESSFNQQSNLSAIRTLRVADILALGLINIRNTADLAQVREEDIVGRISTDDPHSSRNAKHWIKQAQLIESGRIDALVEYQTSL